MDEQEAARAERDERILDVIRSLREGEVVTYGDIAADAGYPKLSRLVGRLLALGGGSDDDQEEPEELPWWRVVNADGTPGARATSVSRPPSSAPKVWTCATAGCGTPPSAGSADGGDQRSDHVGGRSR